MIFCGFCVLLAESPAGSICSVTLHPARWLLQEGQTAACLRCDLMASPSIVLQIWGRVAHSGFPEDVVGAQ